MVWHKLTQVVRKAEAGYGRRPAGSQTGVALLASGDGCALFVEFGRKPVDGRAGAAGR